MRLPFVLSALFIGFVLTSCKGIEEPSVKEIKNVDIENLDTENFRATADMVIYNPNAFALDLASADLVAIVDGIEVADITQNYDTKMPANSDFDMPINIAMDLNKLYGDQPLNALGKSLQIISRRELEVHFKGSLKVGKGSMKITVPIDKVELVKF